MPFDSIVQRCREKTFTIDAPNQDVFIKSKKATVTTTTNTEEEKKQKRQSFKLKFFLEKKNTHTYIMSDKPHMECYLVTFPHSLSKITSRKNYAVCNAFEIFSSNTLATNKWRQFSIVPCRNIWYVKQQPATIGCTVHTHTTPTETLSWPDQI